MSTPKWASGTLYLPGALVQPVQALPPVSAALTNPGFESGASGWTLGANWAINTSNAFAGTWAAEFGATVGTTQIKNNQVANVTPGTSITASIMVQQGAGAAGTVGAAVQLIWMDNALAIIRTDTGNSVSSGSGGAWNPSTVTGICPAGAVKVQLAAQGVRNSGGSSLWVDNATWNYVQQTAPAGLIYTAVQAEAGTSGSDEPVWPTTLGLTVVDNEVTWEAVATSRVVWEASPILQSGTTEPVWPTLPGSFVSDGTISWECITRRVEDVNCPNTKVVAIISSKVYAVDRDIVRFCATANPLDWTSTADAGFLPTGLQQANANDMAVLAPYRANLSAFNASSFQNWQVDPDPAAMAILDQMEGIGSTWPKAAQPVGNELFFLAALGVRTVGISAGAENLSAGDVGMPIDPLVQEAIDIALANSLKALATYYPSAGQYWLAFPDYPPSALSILGDPPDSVVGAAYTTTFTAQGGVQPYSFAHTGGTLPTGTSLGSSGVLFGVTTAEGLFTFDVTVTDFLGDTATGTFDVNVTLDLTISGQAPDGVVGQAYTFTYTTAGGVPPRVVSNNSGTLPTSLSLSGAGVLSGTPTVAGTYVFEPKVTDDVANTDAIPDTVVIADEVNWFALTNGNTVGDYNNNFQTSDNGTTWTSNTLGSPERSQVCVTAGEGRLIAYTQSGALDYSDDGGATWARLSGVAPSTGIGFNGTYAHGKFYVPGGSYGVHHSVDGVNWVSVSVGSTPHVYTIAAKPARVMAAGLYGRVRYSDDNCVTWSAYVDAFPGGVGSDSINSSATDDSIFVVGGDSHRMAFSADAINWTAIASPFTGTADRVQCMKYSSGLWVAGSSNGEIAYSENGLVWTLATDGLGGACNAVDGANGLFVMVGAGGRIASSPDGDNWTAWANTDAVTKDFTGVTVMIGAPLA